MGLLNNLLGYWKFDEEEGTTATDETETYDGTITGSPTLGETGIINYGIKFVSEADVEKCVEWDGEDFGLATSDDFSVSLWVKVTNFSGDSEWIWNKYLDDDKVNFNIKVNNTSEKFEFNRTRYNEDETTITSDTINAGQWYHLVMTVSGGTTWNAYIDGIHIDEETATGTGSGGATYTEGMKIGSYMTFGTDSINAVVDEVGLWDKVLTTRDIYQLYSGGAGTEYKDFFAGTYQQESSSGRINLGGERILRDNKNRLFRRATTEGEVKVEEEETQQIIPATSFNSSDIQKTKTTTTYTTLISTRHKSKTGKVIIQAKTSWLVQVSNSCGSFELTQGGTTITGTESNNQWNTGDGGSLVSLTGYYEPEKDEEITYALKWKRGAGTSNIIAGGSIGGYSILVQDIL